MEQRTTENGRLAEHPGILTEQQRNSSRTPRNNEIIQNETHLTLSTQGWKIFYCRYKLLTHLFIYFFLFKVGLHEVKIFF